LKPRPITFQTWHDNGDRINREGIQITENFAIDLREPHVWVVTHIPSGCKTPGVRFGFRRKADAARAAKDLQALKFDWSSIETKNLAPPEGFREIMLRHDAGLWCSRATTGTPAGLPAA
jgi:hypothetical protein